MINLGTITAAGPLLLAPIAGFFDSPFRRIARRHGAGLTVTELVSAEGIVRMNRKTAELLRFHEEERPLAIQIFGNRPDLMAEAAAVVEGLRPDFIDINMGCPARRICNAGSGAALLLDPGMMHGIAAAMVKRVKLPVTAKIRLGWDDERLTYRDAVRALEDAGVAAIFVHGRTRAQQYAGQADWNAIAEIAAMARVPVVGNGDIRTRAEAMEHMAASGCAAVMIGRGAIGNPWVFSGAVPSFAEVVDQIKQHLDVMIEFYGDKGIVLMRKHIVRYIHAFRGAKHVRRELVVSVDRDEIHRILDALAESHPDLPRDESAAAPPPDPVDE